MAVNKVEVDGEIKLDLTEDTVTPETLLKGATAHNAAGEAITGTLEAGGGSAAEGDITFYDYEGTIVESWTLAELANKTALPAYPSHEGLICQGWNWSLADLKSTNRKMNVGAMYITDDGKTRIYIHLEEGRTSPMLGVCPNGTVTVDWGDGTTPDTLTGTSTSTIKWTPTHNYAAPGDYVIKLTVSGTIRFGSVSASNYCPTLSYASGYDKRNNVYTASINKVELGGTELGLGGMSFYGCANLKSITLHSGLRDLNSSEFWGANSLTFITIPNGVSHIPSTVFQSSGLKTIALPNTITGMSSSFVSCPNLRFISIPTHVTTIPSSIFKSCTALSSIIFPNSITDLYFRAFSGCNGIAFYDFSRNTAVPTLGATSVFDGIAADCEIRVPAALVDEWKAATNWATYADHIVGV